MKQSAVVIIALSIIVIIIFALFIVTTIYYSQSQPSQTASESQSEIEPGACALSCFSTSTTQLARLDKLKLGSAKGYEELHRRSLSITIASRLRYGQHMCVIT